MCSLTLYILSFVYRPPPTYTPFPYTTLFRSGVFRAQLLLAQGQRPGQGRLGLGEVHPSPFARANGALDRKSTRLNSSHRCISYAVLCFKNKKISNHS